MNRVPCLLALAACSVLAAGTLAPALLRAADPPATAPAATAPAARELDAVQADLDAAGKELRAALPSNELIIDAKFRQENAAKILPPLLKVAALLDEIATNFKEPAATFRRMFYLQMAVALGDKSAADDLAALGASKDGQVALAAKSNLAVGRWISSSADPGAQAKILDDYAALAKADPKEDSYADTLKTMATIAPASEELSKKAIAVIQDNLTGDEAKTVIAQYAPVDKPVDIAGRTTANGKFSTQSLKGKVVLVDFWATWCVPCIASLPEVRKVYQTYHEKGLEIVGVDNDATDDVVAAFTKQNNMPWMQLRETSQTDQDYWHPLSKKYAPEGIPTMLLIDKKGVLRYIDARDNMESKIKKLLAEPDAGKPVPAK